MLSNGYRPVIHFARLLAAIFVSAGVAESAADDYVSNVIVATDFSSSYYTPETFPNIENNYRELSRAMTARTSGLRGPTLFQVIPIDELSQAKRPLCEFTLQERALIRKDEECEQRRDCSDNPRDLKNYIEKICSKTVIDRGEGGATDIEGALSLAGQLASSQKADNRYLIIFSDMEEYRQESVISTPPDLSGFQVLVVCGGLFETSGFCMSKEAAWSSKLKEYGATSVEFVIESSRWSTLARDLFE